MNDILRDSIRKDTKKIVNSIFPMKIIISALKKYGAKQICKNYFDYYYSGDINDFDTFLENKLQDVVIKLVGIKDYVVEEKFDIYDYDYDKYNMEGKFSSEVKISGFSNILKCNMSSYRCEDLLGNDCTSVAYIKTQMNYFNPFEQKVYFTGTFRNDSCDDNTLVNYLSKYLSFSIVGITEYDNISEWQTYLIESCVNYQMGNKKMAFFNAFASLDKFIELMYERIFDMYVENYKKYKKIDNAADDELKYKIRKFANVNRRLIDEKLTDCYKECVSLSTTNFKEIKKQLNDLEKMRNTIAHGEEIVNPVDYIRLIKCILSLGIIFNGEDSLKTLLIDVV